MYSNGYGVLKDKAEAVKWWRLSAEQGNVYAQDDLGLMYFNADGVPRDFAEALKWFSLAAKQGRAEAQSKLGLMYLKGWGILKDSLTAHMWYNIASANGSNGAGQRRDRLEALMTADAIEKATTMAKECMASDYKKCGY